MGTNADSPIGKPGAIVRKVTFGGMEKDALLSRLADEQIALNDYARMIFSSSRFETSPKEIEAEFVEVRIRDLGFRDGAMFAQVFDKALGIGFVPCPMEVAPYFRLLYRDQVEDDGHETEKAPKGAVTVFSRPLFDRDDFPKGFYLRNQKGELWLRGYTCSEEYRWDRDTKILLMRQESTEG